MLGPRSRFRPNGFTLVELLIVIIVIAVLAAIAIPKFTDSSIRSKEASLKRSLRIIRDAEERCVADTGLTIDVPDLISDRPPSYGWIPGPMGTGWTKVFFSNLPADIWHGPYLHSVPVNPISGTNTYITGGNSAASWTHFSNQGFNKSFIYFPSTSISSEGTAFRTW